MIILGSFFYVLEKLAGRTREQRLFREGYATDLLYFLTAPLIRAAAKGVILVPAAILILLQLTTPEEMRPGLYHGYGMLSRQPHWLQALQTYLLVDFLGYWNHRLFHTGRLWLFYAVHHSSQEVDWLASARVHPVNDLVNLLVQASPVLLLGYNPPITLSNAPVLTLYAIALHMNVNWHSGPLRFWIASPVFHRWHHSAAHEARNKNFAGCLHTCAKSG